MIILNIIYVVAAVLVLFGAAIFVHEFGHFWVARKLGMKVEEFAIGFGPKIYSWKRDGIEYSLRWIPAGGFVKLPQMITSEALEGKTDATNSAARAAVAQNPVAFAGPFMNVVFAFAIATVIYFVGLPVPVNPPIIGYVEPGSAEAKLGIQEGDVIVAVDGKPINSWQDVIMDTTSWRAPTCCRWSSNTTARQTPTNFRPTSGQCARPEDAESRPARPSRVMQVDVAAARRTRPGLKPGDEIISFAGVPVASREQLIDLIQQMRRASRREMRVQARRDKDDR